MTSLNAAPRAVPGSAWSRSKKVRSERTITTAPMSSALKMASAGTTRPRPQSTRREALLRPGSAGGLIGVGSAMGGHDVGHLAGLLGLHDPDGPRTAHEQPELLGRGRLGVEDVHDPALGHHRDPVGKREDLVELGGDDEDGGALVPLLDDSTMDVLDRADVQPPGRLGCDEEMDRPRELASDDDLLLVAARQVPHTVEDRWRSDVEVLDELLGCRLDRL